MSIDRPDPPLPLQELRSQYSADLFDDYLPFLAKHVIDYELGGFFCNATPFGERISTTKRIWYEGRGVWVLSFLYNNFGHDPAYLEIAAKTVRLLEKSKPQGPDEMWPIYIGREGNPESPPDREIYGDLFIAEGLMEFYKATREERHWKLMMDIVRKCKRVYVSERYHPEIGETYFGPGARPFGGARIQGAWMVFLRLATQALKIRQESEIEEIANEAIDAIVNYHFNPRFGLNNELLNHDLSRPTNEYEQFVYAGHAIETLWMLMDEALRRKDSALFQLAADRFRRHCEVSWDQVYGGLFCNLKNVDENQWVLNKVLFPQQEALIGCVMLVEQISDPWAASFFRRLNSYVHEKFPMKRHGSPLWQITSNRFVDFTPNTTRVENYHHPRFLMLNLLALTRLLGA